MTELLITHKCVLDEIKSLFKRTLREDHAFNDITTSTCLSFDMPAQGSIVLKENGCIAGVDFLFDLLREIEPSLKVKTLIKDGDYLNSGSTLAIISGSAKFLLNIERSVLNLLQHLSGIATTTYECKQILNNLDCDILDTRKTIPGMRLIQKYAVKKGGGKNHRLHLADRFLIKNNHLSLLSIKTTSPLLTAVRQAKESTHNCFIQIEVDCFDQLDESLIEQADGFVLDNMQPEEVKRCVEKINKRAYAEASGNINNQNLLSYAKTGVDGVSMGFLTHSSKALDISMRIESV